MLNRQGTKKILRITIFSIVALIVVGYALFTSYDYMQGPKIVVHEPQSGSTLATSTVVVSGYAVHVIDITFNGRSILVDNKGNFNETALLAPGYNAFTLFARDKFGRTTEHRLELIYRVN